VVDSTLMSCLVRVRTRRVPRPPHETNLDRVIISIDIRCFLCPSLLSKAPLDEVMGGIVEVAESP
jgi:hypothetical protein